MALITNTNRITPIGLPSGAVIPPGASVDVPEWDDIKDRKNLAFYVVSGVLVVEGGVQSDGQGGEEAYRQQTVRRAEGPGRECRRQKQDRDPGFETGGGQGHAAR